MCGGRRLRAAAAAVGGTLPLISVVTVVYNGGNSLRSTIQSVLNQKRGDIEYIVVDGGSTDGTIGTLHSFDDYLDYWISEPDAGIYDAMNKGIVLARGQWIYHLNIGDHLLRLPQLFDYPISNNVMCIGAVVQTSNDQVHIPSAGIALRFHNTLHHQGCFYRNTSRLRYDIRYKVFADFNLNQQLLLSGAQILLCQDVVAMHDGGGVSHTTSRFFEVYHIVRRNFGPFWTVVCFLYFKYRSLRNRLQLL